MFLRRKSEIIWQFEYFTSFSVKETQFLSPNPRSVRSRVSSYISVTAKRFKIQPILDQTTNPAVIGMCQYKDIKRESEITDFQFKEKRKKKRKGPDKERGKTYEGYNKELKLDLSPSAARRSGPQNANTMR